MSSAKTQAQAQAQPARATRPARPAAPPLPAFEALDQTHHQIMRMLERLKTLHEHLAAQGVDDLARELAAEICEFFDGNARAHHEAEERVVFPALLSGGDASLIQHVHRLQQDHGWLEEDWLELQPQLKAVSEGYSWYDLDTLHAAIPIFSELYRDHIALEENIIYPASRGQQS
jgi:hemerythrin-like domain-containing protein